MALTAPSYAPTSRICSSSTERLRAPSSGALTRRTVSLRRPCCGSARRRAMPALYSLREHCGHSMCKFPIGPAKMWLVFSGPSLFPTRSRAIVETRRSASNRLLRMEPRRSARVNAPGQSTDTPERRKPPRRRVPTPPLSTSRQAKRTTRVRPLVPSLVVAEILVSPDLLPHMLEHLSMRQLHRVSAVCRAFRAAVPTALLLRRALCPKPTRGAHVNSLTRARNLPSRTRTRPCALPSLRWQSWSASGVRRMLWRCLMGALWLQIATTIA